MHQLETNILTQLNLKPDYWFRYIDDIFTIWPHGEGELQHMITIMNHFHHTIKFTHSYDFNTIPFLDTLVCRDNNNKIYTKLYHKPTDNKHYLHFHSAHPRKQKESVPYGLLIRSRRICTKEEDYHQEAKDIINKLILRKYPKALLTTAYTKVTNMSRSSLLKNSKREDNSKIRLITNYNPKNPNFRDILKKYEDILLLTRKQAISPDDIQVTYSRSPNLKDILVRANLTYTPTPRICQPCYKTHCRTCVHINSNIAVTNQQNTSFPIRGNFNCQSFNIVYIMTCEICNIQYVGETSNTLNTRCRGHESAIRNEKDHLVAQHFNSYNHSWHDYNITAVDKESDKNRRLRLEEPWMQLMDTLWQKALMPDFDQKPVYYHLNWNCTFSGLEQQLLVPTHTCGGKLTRSRRQT